MPCDAALFVAPIRRFRDDQQANFPARLMRPTHAGAGSIAGEGSCMQGMRDAFCHAAHFVTGEALGIDPAQDDGGTESLAGGRCRGGD
jgi:hypothetical protein